MGYREELRPASYKGVPFFVDDASRTGGKRAIIHQYVERDDHFVEELGALAWQFPVTAHLLGDDVFAQRDRLVLALRSKGPGTLVLPSLGEIQAHCLDIHAHDSITGEGRITRLGLTFVESGKNQFPGATVDTGQVVLDQSDVGIGSLQNTFSSLFEVPDLSPTSLLDAAVGISFDIIEGIAGAISRADGLTELKDELLRDASALQSNLRSVAMTPSSLASSLTSTFRGFTSLLNTPRSIFSELETLTTQLDALAAVATPTANRKIQAKNQAALQAINSRTAIVEMARVATVIELVSSDDAAALRDQIDLVLDVEITAAGDSGEDETFAELRKLRAKVVQDLDARGARLPAVRTFKVPGNTPAIVIAHRLYDDPGRDAEIVARNGIRSPGFIRANRELSVLAE